MKKESFIIYTSFYKPISSLSDKQMGRLFRAIFKYNLGEVVSVEEDIRMAFDFFINQINIDESKRQEKIMRDTGNGRRGGNPNFRKGHTNPYYQDRDNSTRMTKIIEDNSFCKNEGNLLKIRGKDNDNPPLSKITQDNPPLSKITPHNPNENENENENENVLEKKPSIEGEKEGGGVPQPEISENYKTFLAWLEANAPYCQQNLAIPTEKEFEKLKAKWEGAEIAEIISQIENRKDLRKNYVNLYLTALNWLKRRYPR